MDIEAIAGMLLTLVLAAMIGGLFLMWPISRRLGAVLEQRLNDRAQNEPMAEQIRQLQATVAALRSDLDRLAERQQFTEALLAGQPTNRLAQTTSPTANGLVATEDR